MIQSASFRNFKSLRHVDVDFERLTVIVGPNASGKTSILEGLHLLTQLATSEPDKIFAGRRDPRLLYSRGVTSETMEIRCESEDTLVRVRAFPPPNPDRERWGFGYNLRPRGQDNRPNENYRDDNLASRFPSAILLRMVATRLAEPSYSDRPDPVVEDDGGGLASVLAFMALNQPDRFHELQEHLRFVIPVIKRVRFNRVPVSRVETEVVTVDNARLSRFVTREYIGDQLILDFQGAPEVPAHLASEGTILTLGLIAALLGEVDPIV
jgi:predicted ATPase